MVIEERKHAKRIIRNKDKEMVEQKEKLFTTYTDTPTAPFAVIFRRFVRIAFTEKTIPPMPTTGY